MGPVILASLVDLEGVCTYIFFYHGSLSHPLRFELSSAVLLEAISIRAVWGHYAVEAGPARLETFLFGLIVAFDQTHEFTHTVT